MVGDDPNVDSVGDDLSVLLELMELVLCELGESELSGDGDFLSAWEFEHGSSESLLGVLNICWADSDGQNNGTNVYSSGLTIGLTEGTSHTLLESICTSTTEHLIDSENVPWVDSDSHVESVLAGLGGHILVASNTGGFKSL